MKTLHLAIITIVLIIMLLPFNTTFAQNATNSTNSIPPNAIRTPNGVWVTPLQTTMKKILDVKEFEKFVESSLNKQILWSNGSPTFTTFFWTPDSKSIIFRVSDVNALWSINPDGTDLKRINETNIVLEAIHHPYNQLGNFEVNTNFCDKCPSGGLTLQIVNGTYTQEIHTGNANPVAPAISPDGNFIVFGSNGDSWNSEQDQGIYLLVLSSPIPEFPFAIIVLLIGITSLVVLYRIRIRK